jgi:transcriptional regulator with XRE-family HTH domain
MTTKKKGNGSLWLYRSYNFVDKDPIIDELRNIQKREGLSYNEIKWLSGVSTTTLYNWFEGSTKRPQNASIEAFARSLGYRRKFEKTSEINYERELIRAKKEKEG